MNEIAERVAAAQFDALEVLCAATPKGWYAERATARVALTYADAAIEALGPAAFGEEYARGQAIDPRAAFTEDRR
ncbi:hypothetical protein ABZS52_30345 [Micromonospora profundi]|uniref:hypothetical protein n=1 Tax=Micromonospora profundi TaxID=1420889 RepID=UPI0033B250E1